jgi:glutamyl-tRNA reductase
VEPRVGELPNVYLYYLDDLQRVVAQSQTGRGEQIERCEAMLEGAVSRCLAEVQNRDVGQLIRALRQRLHELGDAERERTLRKLAAGPPGGAQDLDAALEEHTQRLINKILHLPLRQLDRRGDDAALGFYAAALRSLFELPEPDSAAPAIDASEAVGEGDSSPVAPPSPARVNRS